MGCSSDVMRFQDALPTSANAQPNGSYAAPQSYPGVDNTYTGTVQSQGANRSTAGILRPRPNGAIGHGQVQTQMAAPQVQNQPFPQVAAAPAAPSGGGVARQALPTVGGPAPAAQPAPQMQAAPSQPQQGQLPGGWTVSEQNGQAPGQQPSPASNGQVAVLPQPPRVDAEQRAPTTTPAANAASGSNTYTVVSGDTLSSISRKTGASTTAIKQANGLSDSLIRVGQRLNIPGAAATTVAATAPANAPRVETAPAVTGSTQPSGTQQQAAAQPAAPSQPAAEPQRSVQEAALNPAQAPNATGISSMRWPVRGRVVSGFGQSVNGKRNDGIDISVPEGTSVRAAENGVVIYAGDGLQEFGNTVLVRHESGLVTVYGHASELKVRRGDNVRRGQEIALSGLSGSAEQPKLHFEVRKDSAPVDPTGYLE